MGAASRRVGLVATVAIPVCLAAATIVSLTIGTTYSWPDNLHTDYGFPWVWGTHLIDSFVGPVDKWTVSLGNLGLDLGFWLAAIIVAVVVIRQVTKQQARVQSDQRSSCRS